MNIYKRRVTKLNRDSVEAAGDRNGLDGLAPRARRLMPFTGDVTSSPASSRAQNDRPPEIPTASGAPGIADTVALAKSILDEDMAQGVIAARQQDRTRPASSGLSVGSPQQVLREIADTLAALWPGRGRSLAGEQTTPVDRGSVTLPLVNCQWVGGERQLCRATMVLRNDESEPVTVDLMTTDLVCATGARIGSEMVDLSPRSARIPTQGEEEVTVAILIPDGVPPGTYFGLLVTGGVEYLRALIQINVNDLDHNETGGGQSSA